MKKRILAAVMAAAMLILGMAGCGSANNSNSEQLPLHLRFHKWCEAHHLL